MAGGRQAEAHGRSRVLMAKLRSLTVCIQKQRNRRLRRLITLFCKHEEAIEMVKKSKKQKVVENIKVLIESVPSTKEGIVMHAGVSRNELMLTVKDRGVKNFRVLNKQELADVLKNIGDQKAVDAIVASAVIRWKSGWGKEKVNNESQS
jgi:hypothetical protein